MKAPTTETIEVCVRALYSLFFSALRSTFGPRALGIRKATAWYSSHISMMNPIIRGRQPKPKPVALLLTDDVQNRIKGEKDGIKCSSSKVSPP